jgi:mono/diheme cytochrome c family protein
MPSFALLSVQGRWGLVYYVRSQIPNPPQPAEVAAREETAQPTVETVTQQTEISVPVVQAEPEGPRIPIQLAMQRLAVSEPEKKPEFSAEREGAVLFTRYCMPCHGPAGESRQTVYLLRINPDRYVRSGNLQNLNAVWVSDQKKFEEIVTQGFPGHLMPGLKSLSQSELQALYRHVLSLAAKSSGN